jgi:hypothetical protein
MSRSGRPALRLPGLRRTGTAGHRRQHCADGQFDSTPEGWIYNDNLSIQFNLIVFT